MFLTSCGCVYCQNCVKECTQAGCFACKGTESPRVLSIGSKMPQSVMEMFNKNEESMSKINKRTEFQSQQYARCLQLRFQRIAEKEDEMRDVDAGIERTDEVIKKLELVNAKKEARIKKLQGILEAVDNKEDRENTLLHP